MQRASTNNLYNELEELINKTYANYQRFIDNGERNSCDYSHMNFGELADFIQIFDEISNGLDTDILDDILNIDLKKAVMGNIYQNMLRKLNPRYYNYSGDYFSSILVQGLKEQYYLKENIESQIRDIFVSLLKGYIETNEDVLLNKILDMYLLNISFKYLMEEKDEELHSRCMRSFASRNISLNKAVCFNRSYLEILIKKTIDALLSMTDEDLVSDREYSKAICLHLLLRAIFMVIGDYKELIPYEEYYNSLEKRETRAKKMIREAFILHYNDTMNEEIKKLAKNKIVDL